MTVALRTLGEGGHSFGITYVRYWPKADIGYCTAHVRFRGESGHAGCRKRCRCGSLISKKKSRSRAAALSFLNNDVTTATLVSRRP
jgi:hypothetical protein